MKELITIEEANTLMLALIVVAPIVGAAIGVLIKQIASGVKWGFGIGLCNFILWKLYNAITSSLGLDTVKNLLVNLALFIALGIIGGIVTANLRRKSSLSGASGDGGGAPVGAGAGPKSRGPGSPKMIEAAGETPRDAR